MSLYIDPKSASVLASARHLVFLIGSFDGNHNAGDVLQLIGVLNHLRHFRKLVTPVILYEAAYSDLLPSVISAHEEAFKDVVFLGRKREDDESEAVKGLSPLPHLAAAEPLALYFYGGGYADEWRGDSKASLADEIVSWLQETGKNTNELPVLVTGVEAHSSAFLETSSLRPWFERASLLRFRNRESAELASSFEHSAYGCDDAMDTIVQSIGLANVARTKAETYRLGIHLNIRYCSDQSLPEYLAIIDQAAAAIAKNTGSSVSIVPILAYEGKAVYESEHIPAISETVAVRGMQLEPALDISKGGNLDQLVGLNGIITTSYHLSMMGSIARIPTILCISSPYYQQELRGLREWFAEDILRHIDLSEPQAVEPIADFLTGDGGEPLSKSNAALAAQSQSEAEIVGREIASLLFGRLTEQNQFLARYSMETKAEVSRLRVTMAHLLNGDKSESHVAPTGNFIMPINPRFRKIYKSPLTLLKSMIYYHIVKFSSRLSPPLPRRTALKLRRSAEKRNPYLLSE